MASATSHITDIPITTITTRGAIASGVLRNLTTDATIDTLGNLVVELQAEVLAGGKREEVVRASVGVEIPLESVGSYLLHALRLDLSGARLPFLRSLADHLSPPKRWVQEDNATCFTYYQRMCPHVEIPDHNDHVEWVMGTEWIREEDHG